MSVFAALISAVVPLAAASATVAPAADCTPIPGWEHVLADDNVHWIVIGELHGTVETPAIFADAVCLTARNRGPITVALEIPSGDQARIDAYMASDGGAAAQSEFLRALIWNMPGAGKDGRSSQAFFGLFERLRQMHAARVVGKVVAFQDSRPTHDPPDAGQSPYEERLAAIVRAAGGHGETVLALVGNAHARKTEVNFGKPFMPMASHLPPSQTITLDAVGNGGAAWNCTGPTPADCGPHESRGALNSASRGVELRPVEDGAYDGLLNLGIATTASPPQTAPWPQAATSSASRP